MHAKTVLHESTGIFVAVEFLVSGAYRKTVFGHLAREGLRGDEIQELTLRGLSI